MGNNTSFLTFGGMINDTFYGTTGIRTGHALKPGQGDTIQEVTVVMPRACPPMTEVQAAFSDGRRVVAQVPANLPVDSKGRVAKETRIDGRVLASPEVERQVIVTTLPAIPGFDIAVVKPMICATCSAMPPHGDKPNETVGLLVPRLIQLSHDKLREIAASLGCNAVLSVNVSQSTNTAAYNNLHNVSVTVTGTPCFIVGMPTVTATTAQIPTIATVHASAPFMA
jgi:hypothetical protein